MRWFLASILILILSYFHIVDPLLGAFHYFLNPVQYGTIRIAESLEDSIRFYSVLKRIYGENQVLVGENKLLRAQVFELNEAFEENEFLRHQLELVETSDMDQSFAFAKVLGNPNDSTGTSIILDKGQNSRIEVGNVVIQGLYLVGVVRDVSPNRSTVDLITSPKLTLSVVDFQTKTEGLSSGQYGTTIQINRVLAGDVINIEDLIISSGKGGRVPPGYILGEVISVSPATAKVFRESVVQTILDLNDLEKVFVILDK